MITTGDDCTLGQDEFDPASYVVVVVLSGTTVGVTCVCVSCDTFTSNQSAKEAFSSSKLICLVSFHNTQ